MNIQEYCQIRTEELGLWNLWAKTESGNDSDYLNLYMHGEKLFFSYIYCNRYGNNKVLIGRAEYLKEIWTPKFVRNPMGFLYTGSALSEYPPDGIFIKNLKIHEIINQAKITEQQKEPSYKGDKEGNALWPIYSIINRITYFGDSSYHSRYSLEKFLRKDESYGNEMLKRCYLNPFIFEKEYPEVVKESNEKANKKWWQIFK